MDRDTGSGRESYSNTASICGGCGELLENVKPVKVERRQVHDAEFRIKITEHRSEHKLCPHCGRLNRGKFPSDVQHPVQYGRNLKAFMVYLNVYQLIPYDRIREMFSDIFRRSISTGTVVNAVQDCQEKLADVEERIRELLVEAPVLHVDETGVRVTGIRQWLPVASTRFLTWYGHHRKREHQATEAMQILPNFRGTMVHDFWASYFRYPSRHALCNAHILRELAGITENYGQKWSEQLRALILEMRTDVDAVRGTSGSLSREKIVKFELRYSRIVKDGFAENPIPH